MCPARDGDLHTYVVRNGLPLPHLSDGLEVVKILVLHYAAPESV